LNLVDSSGWVEYFIDSSNAEFFAPIIEDTKNLIVPSICIYEVFKKLLVDADENAALQAVTQMQQGAIVNLDEPLAINAAKIGFDFKLPLADSIILATAQQFHATLYTQDEHFKGKPGVEFRGKKK
jgi:toxin FitB